MWWGITAAVTVTWLFGLTHATLHAKMWMEPEDKNVYYVEEGGPKSIQCIVKVDIGVTVNLTWSGPSIDASKPQRVSNIPQENYDLVGNWLNITHFSNTTAGEYKCRATSASPAIDLTQPIRLVKGCDVGNFNPPSCNESCSAYCNPVPNGAKGRNCDHISGRCLHGCQEGHAGLECTECDNERFNNPFCNKNCSTYCNPGPNEAKGRNCDQINGTCLSGCQEGYKMPNCTEKVDDPGDKDIRRTIGGSIGGFLGFIVVVIVVVLLVRCLKKRRKDAATPANQHERQKERERFLNEKDDEIEKLKADNDQYKREMESQKTSYENTISNLQRQINQLETEKRNLEQDKEKADGKISTLKAEIDKQKEEKKNRRESYFNLSLQYAEVKQQLEDLIKQREEMKRKLEKLEKNEKKLQEEKAKLEGDKKFLEGRLQELPTKKSAEKLQQEKAKLERDKGFLEGRLQEKESAENIQAQLATMQKELLEKERDLLKVTSEKNKTQEQFEEINAKLDDLSRGFLKTQEEQQKLIQMQEADINTLKDEIKQRTEEKESADKSIASLKEQMEHKDKEHQDKKENLKTQIDCLKKDKEKLQELKQKQEAEVKRLTGKINQMSQEKTTADKEIERFKEQLKNKEEQHQAEKANLNTQIDRLTKENKNLHAQIQEQDAQVMRLKEDINHMKEEKNKTDDDIDLSTTRTVGGAQMLQAKNRPGTGFNAHTRCRLFRKSETTIKKYDIVETNYGGHFDSASGCYTVPKHGRYLVTFSTDHLSGCLDLYLHQEHGSGKSNTTICDNKSSLLNNGVKEGTCDHILRRGDRLFLVGSLEDRSTIIDVNVNFSVSCLE